MSHAPSKYVWSVDGSGVTLAISSSLVSRSGWPQSSLPDIRAILMKLFGMSAEDAEQIKRVWLDAAASNDEALDETLTLVCRDGTRVRTRWRLSAGAGDRDQTGGLVAVGDDAVEDDAPEVHDVVAAYGLTGEPGQAVPADRLSALDGDSSGSVVSEDEPSTLGGVLATLAEGVVTIDEEGRVTSINPAARQLLGIGDLPVEGERVGGPRLSAGSPAGNLVLAVEHDPAAAARGTWQREVTLPGPRPTRLVVTSSPLDAEPGEATGRVYVLRDVGAERDVDQAMGEMLATVSHDLRTPLTPILGLTSLLAKGKMGRLSPRQAEVLGRIHRQSARLLGLVNDLLDTARLDRSDLRLDVRRVGLVPLLRARVDEATVRGALKQVHVRLDVASELPDVIGDESRLNRVVDILLENAIAFSPRGEAVALKAYAQGGTVVVSVSDHGPGIAKSALPHVFDRFHQVFPQGKKTRGSGLGLYLAASIVRLHDGRIWVEPGVSKGCMFSFSLPAAPAEPESPEPGP